MAKPPSGGPDDLPTKEVCDVIDSIGVEDEEGKQRPFEGLIRHGKTFVVFTRHFGCSLCSDYLVALKNRIAPEKLAAQNVKIIVVSCGHWSMIGPYRDLHECPYPIYAEKTKKLYDELQMTRPTLMKTAPEGEYTYGESLFNSTVKGFSNLWKMGKLFSPGQMGQITQLGGEFMFEDGKCTWAHRMQHTRDHTPVDKVAELLGVP